MGHFYTPPPPIISATGAQPYAPNKLPPAITAVPVNNPPQNEDAVDNLIEILAIWNPPVVHNWVHRAGQPFDWQKLPPQITAVPVNNPSPNEDQIVNLAVVLSAWNPSSWDPSTSHEYIHRAGQAYDYAKLAPGIPGQSVDNPKPNENQVVNLSDILSIWNPPVVHNWTHKAGQPYDYGKMAPGIPGQSVDNPIPNEDTLVNINDILSIYNPPVVHNYIHRAGQPYDYAKMSPGIPGQSVDKPPLIKGFVPYPITPDPLPTIPFRSVGNPGWSVDNPPGLRQPFIYYDTPPPLPQTLVLQPQAFTPVVTAQGPYVNQWMATVISIWPIDYPLPQLGTKLPPQITAVPVNNPPFFSRTEIPNILRQWQPPDPLPALSIRSVGNPGWSVDNPPAYTRIQLPYPDTPPLPQTLVLQPQGTPTVVTVQGPYTNLWIATVIAAWVPPDPLPTLPIRSVGNPGWSVDNPIPNENASVNLNNILSIYNPVPGSTHNYIHRAGQPYDYAKMSPGIPGQSVDNPIPNENASVNLNNILSIYNPVPVHNYIHRAGQPYDYGKMAPGIPGQSVDNPIPNANALANFNNILSIYNPPPGSTHNYVHKAEQPYDYAKMSPGIPGQSVDNPPTIKGFVPYPIPYWADPNNLPQTLTLQVQPFVQPLISYTYISQWLSTVLGTWQPDLSRVPTLNNKLPSSVSAVPVNNPPFGSRSEMPNILAQWQPPPPQPYPSFKIKIVQGGAVVTVSVRDWLIRARRRRR